MERTHWSHFPEVGMYVRLDDGAELFYTVDDYTDPWTQPETVVLHHGMAKNHKLWYAWVPMLAQHYRVVRFDMRGMGQSSVHSPGYLWSLENFDRDLLGLLDQLGLSRVHLIGETVGGSIAMRFATLHQDRLLSLAVCTSPVTFDAHHTESAEVIERADPYPGAGGGPFARGGIGRLPGRRRSVPQRALGGISRCHRVCPAHSP